MSPVTLTDWECLSPSASSIGCSGAARLGRDGDDVDLDGGRDRDRPIEWSVLLVGLDEPLGVRLTDASNGEVHADALEAIRRGGASHSFDRNLQALDWHAPLLCVLLDQCDLVGGDAGQECLTVGQGV